MSTSAARADSSFMDDVASLLDAVDAALHETAETLPSSSEAQETGARVAATPPPEVLADDLALLLLGASGDDTSADAATLTSTPTLIPNVLCKSEQLAQSIVKEPSGDELSTASRSSDSACPLSVLSEETKENRFVGPQHERSSVTAVGSDVLRVNVVGLADSHGLSTSAGGDQVAVGIRKDVATTPPAEILADDLALLLLGVDADDMLACSLSSSDEARLDSQTSLVDTFDRNEPAAQASTPRQITPGSGKRGKPPLGKASAENGAKTSPRGSATRSKKFRTRQREEFEHLRHQVRDLEDQLGSLKQSKRCCAQSPRVTTAVKEEYKPPTMSTSEVWERIAKKQMSAKQKAEAENTKLREMLEEQLKITRGLEKVLRKRSSKHTVNDLDESKRRKRVASTDGTQKYEQLVANLDGRFKEAGAVFKENGLAANRADLEETRLLAPHDSDESTTEILFSKVLPFEFARVCAAMWKCSSLSCMQFSHGIYSAHELAFDDLKITVDMSLQVKRHTVSLPTLLALRRRHVQGDDKVVYAWESESTMISDHKAYDGLPIHGHGWIAIERLTSSDPSQQSTIVQCCSRLAIDETPNTPSALNAAIAEAYNAHHATIHELVENLLLEETLGI